MSLIRYALERVGEKDLELSWSGNWENLKVLYKGELLGVVTTKNEFLEGRRFDLPNGRVLSMRLSTKYFESGIFLDVDGEPLPRSAGDPEIKIEIAVILTFFLGSVSLVLGLIFEVFQIEVLKKVAVSGINILVGGLLFILAGFILWRHRWALVLTIIILILEALVGTFLAVSNDQEPNISALAFLKIFLLPLLKALGFLNKINKNKEKHEH